MSCGRFGVRNTMAAATLMSFAAVLGTAFSPNIYLVYFTYGGNIVCEAIMIYCYLHVQKNLTELGNFYSKIS